MSRTRVAVIDYGIGNLFSVCHALEQLGADVELTGEHDRILACDRAVLPGVGAFGRGMQELNIRKLDKTVRDFAESGKPLAGICLGMQMLLAESEENTSEKGLGLIDGNVVRVPSEAADRSSHKVPHIAWGALDLNQSAQDSLATRLVSEDAGDKDKTFYFVHSFHAAPAHNGNRIATVSYDGVPLTAVIGRDNVCGLQFHPERSGPVGMQLLSRFLTA